MTMIREQSKRPTVIQEKLDGHRHRHSHYISRCISMYMHIVCAGAAICRNEEKKMRRKEKKNEREFLRIGPANDSTQPIYFRLNVISRRFYC